MFGPFVVGLLAAASNATSNVLQRGAHIDALAETNQKFSLDFLMDVVRRPRWLLGIITMMISFILQSIGLGLSSLAVIQPLIVLELPFALIGAALFLKEELSNREWIGATLMFGGVILFVAMLSPNPGEVRHMVGTVQGAGAMLITVAVGVLFYLISLRSGPRLKTGLLGISAGIGFGLTAVIIKDMTVRIMTDGLLSIFTSWQVYMVIAFGLISLYIFQYALATGRLMYAQPGVTLADPFIAVTWGVVVFNEEIRTGIYLVFALVGVAMAAAGVILIARGSLDRHKGQD